MATHMLGVAVADEQGVVLEANDAFLELLDQDRETLEAGDLRWEALVPPRYAPATADALLHAPRGGPRSFLVERDWIRANGDLVPTRISLQPLEGGLRYLALVQDLSEHRHAETMLRFLSEASRVLSQCPGHSSSSLLRMARWATRSVADACQVSLVQPDGHLRAVACAHRLPHHEDLLRHLPHPPLLPGLAQHLGGAFPHGHARLFEKLAPPLQEQLVSDAAARARLLSRRSSAPPLAVPLRSQGHVLGVLLLVPGGPAAPACAVDVTTAEELGRRVSTALENTRLLKETRQAGHRARFLAEASRLLSSSLDHASTLESVVRLAIPTVADWCAIDMPREGFLRRVAVAHRDPEKEALGWEIDRRWPYRLEDPLGISAVFRTGEPQMYLDLTDADLAAGAQDAEHLTVLRSLGVHASMHAPLKARGRVIGTISFVLAETQRHFTEQDMRMAMDLADRAAMAIDNARLYQESRRAVRVRDAFLAVASHELKGPLTPLQLRLQTLQRELEAAPTLDRERTGAHVTVLRRQTRRLATLVDSLLDVSRIEAGTLELDPRDTDLDAVVRDIAARFEGQAERVHSALDLALGGPLVGRWDAGRLEQVVTHLVGNALKYGAGRPVHLETRRDGPLALLTVRDEGIGIDPEELPRIFGRFERAVSSEHFGGLGLGLYLTRALVEAMGGTIEVASEPGRGAAFEVRLPLSPPG